MIPSAAILDRLRVSRRFVLLGFTQLTLGLVGLTFETLIVAMRGIGRATWCAGADDRPGWDVLANAEAE
jgi:hypothetical protein